MAELVHVHKCTNMNRHALVWPRPSHILTFVPRRSPHRLSSKAGYKSWRHPLAPRLPTSQNHIPAPIQGIAVRTDDTQVASPVSKESPWRPQRGLRLPHQNQTYRLDQDPDLDYPLSSLPGFSKRSVSDHALCRQTVNMFQQPGLATFLRSARQTCSPPCGSTSLFCVNYELQPLQGCSSRRAAHAAN